MSITSLEIPPKAYSGLVNHLLPSKPKSEEAAFVFCSPVQSGRDVRFTFVESYVVPPSDFRYRSLFGLELSDCCRARVIKRAHDLNTSLLELHSHPLAELVRFSPSDRSGFEEFVPHVWWRLKQRPYAAIVMGRTGFDSLSWLSDPMRPDGVLEVQIGEHRLMPTGLTYKHWEDTDDFKT